MARDPGLEETMRGDIGDRPGITDRVMFGGLCFFLDGHMLCAARAGRAMYRVGKPNDAAARALPGVTPMIHGGRAKPGYVWLDDTHLADDDLRARLTRWALDTVAELPPKET